jgi:hypothetical protein
VANCVKTAFGPSRPTLAWLALRLFVEPRVSVALLATSHVPPVRVVPVTWLIAPVTSSVPDWTSSVPALLRGFASVKVELPAATSSVPELVSIPDPPIVPPIHWLLPEIVTAPPRVSDPPVRSRPPARPADEEMSSAAPVETASTEPANVVMLAAASASLTVTVTPG